MDKDKLIEGLKYLREQIRGYVQYDDAELINIAIKYLSQDVIHSKELFHRKGVLSYVK